MPSYPKNLYIQLHVYVNVCTKKNISWGKHDNECNKDPICYLYMIQKVNIYIIGHGGMVTKTNKSIRMRA